MKKLLLSIFVVTNFMSYSSGDGTLDTATFNPTGTPPNGPGFVYAPVGQMINAVAVQTDGNIVACGQSLPDNTIGQIVRYTPDGSIDASFGGGAVTQPDFFASDLIIQADGNILVAGWQNSDMTHLMLVRYLPNGDLDQSFGAGSGTVNIAGAGFANSVTLQADGKIIVAGGDQTFSFVQVTRFLPDGTQDTVFQTTVEDNSAGAKGIVIQPDGKIITANINLSGQLQAIRYTPDGNLDATFNGTGVVVLTTSVTIDRNMGVLLQPSAAVDQLKIILGGSRFINIGDKIVVARLNSDGSVDTTFVPSSVSPIIPIPGSMFIGDNIVLQAKSKIVVSGVSTDGSNFVLMRLTSDGIVDATWNTGSLNPGFTVGPLGESFNATIQSDGKIIAAGTNFTGDAFAIARYNSSPLFTPTAITIPVSGSTIVSGPITFSGTAQSPSVVYLLIDGVVVSGTYTDPNNWTITTTLSSGTHTAQAISIYQNKKLNITSDPITFTVTNGPSCIVPPLTNTSELVRAIITKYCCR